MNVEAMVHVATDPKPLLYPVLYADYKLEQHCSNNYYVVVLASGDQKALLAELQWSASRCYCVYSAPGKPLLKQLLEIVPFLCTELRLSGSLLDICP